MTIKLFLEAIFKFLLGIVLVGCLVFIPAGTFDYLYGWLFMGVLFIPMFVAGIVMMIKNPKLLASRLDAKEKQKSQGVVIKLSGLMFIVGFVLAGLDFRFKWFVIPSFIPYIAAGIFLIGYVLWGVVLKQNTYLSRTIKVVEGQTVIDSGLYKVVRHPMYSATILMFLAMPLILGSVIALSVFILYPILIAFRTVEEEKLLSIELVGYEEYKKKVKYRIIPFIW